VPVDGDARFPNEVDHFGEEALALTEVSVTPWLRVTPDALVIDSLLPRVGRVWVSALRARVEL
jgi:hypothetical protein